VGVKHGAIIGMKALPEELVAFFCGHATGEDQGVT